MKDRDNNTFDYPDILIYSQQNPKIDLDWEEQYAPSADILGQTYLIQFKNAGEDPEFKDRTVGVGCCNLWEKKIKIRKPTANSFPEGTPDDVKIRRVNKTLRHEIVHAYLHESGLDDNSFTALNRPTPWAKNEEMVDWFAIQGPKIMQTWREVGCEE